MIPESKHLGKTFSTLAVTGSGGNDLKELVELDGAVHGTEALNHLQDNLAPTLETQLLKDLLDFFWIYGPSLVSIEEVECGFQLFVVVLGDPVLPGLFLGTGSGGILSAGNHFAIPH